MSKTKIIALIAVMSLAFGMTAIGNAVAGEKHKIRGVMYATKWEQLNVPGEEKHLIALYEDRGITTNMEGKKFCEGAVTHEVLLIDIDLKTGLGSLHGYGETTDRDGDKIYWTTKGKRLRGELWASYWECESTYVRGTGKYEGIKGKVTWESYPVSPMQSYTDEVHEIELPAR